MSSISELFKTCLKDNNNSPRRFIIQASPKLIKQDFGLLCNNKKFSDIIFVVGKDDQKQRFPAHKLILSARNDVFEAMFFGALAMKSDEIEIPDVEPTGFNALLNFLYCNEVEIDADIVLSTLYAARKYVVHELEEYCIDFLEISLTSDNAFLLLTQALLYDKPKLAEICLDMIDQNTSEALYGDGFTDIDLKTLILILKRPTLQAFESKLFEATMLWSKSECVRKKLPITAKNQRFVLGPALMFINFSYMTLKVFEKGPIESSLLNDSEIREFLKSLNKNSTERPRCGTKPNEVRIKFYSEAKTNLTQDLTFWHWFSFNQTAFIVGFIVLNIAKYKSNVRLTLTNECNMGEEILAVVNQTNDLTPSPETLTFLFNKPIKLRYYGKHNLEVKFDEIVDNIDERPFWTPLNVGVVKQCGLKDKNIDNFLQAWNPVFCNMVSEIIFYE